MSLRESQGHINRAMQELLSRWDRTRDTWRDERARQFEAGVLDPLGAKVRLATSAMDRMANDLQRARRECARLSDE